MSNKAEIVGYTLKRYGVGRRVGVCVEINLRGERIRAGVVLDRDKSLGEAIDKLDLWIADREKL